MAKKENKRLIVGLDIGTSKIAAVVGEIGDDQLIAVIGFGSHPSNGLKRGVVVNIEATVQSMQHALEEAELMAGCEINSAYTGIAGSHIRSLNSHGIVAIRDREVNSADVERVIDAAKAVAIPADQKMIHVLPQEFIIDSQEGVRHPIGMAGVRLEAKVHIVTGAVSAAQNIHKCLRRCGVQLNDIVLEQLASSYAVLTEDEKELGVCMVDIGGGTTDIAIFTDGAIRHTTGIPIAGDSVTNDIAIALRTSTQAAEQIKIEHAALICEREDLTATIQVPSVANRPAKQIAKKDLIHVAESRYAEIFSLVMTNLRRSGFEDLIPAGIVLTGGASKIKGCADLAERILNMPARLGQPQNVRGLVDVRENPSYSTGIGLLLHGLQQQQGFGPQIQLDGSATGLWSRMKNWFHGHF